MFKKLLCILLLSVSLSYSYAQHLPKMNAWQDSLLVLSNRMFSSVNEAERMESNFKFVKTLVSSLKEANAFYYAFDKLKSISILNAPDNSFRIFSWNIPLDDGSYLYYGSIQHKSNTIKLTPLLDKTFEIENVETAVLPANNWYGAQYYDIVPLQTNQYALLGWKGHHADYSQKLIEILTIGKDGSVSFGANVFSNLPNIKRKVFSYTRQASMYLRYNDSKKQIEFDHIVPINEEFNGNYKYYGPDLSHDAYALKNNQLFFIENITVENPTSTKDDLFVDPLKPKKGLKSGLK